MSACSARVILQTVVEGRRETPRIRNEALPAPRSPGTRCLGRSRPWALKRLQQFAEPVPEELRPNQGQIGRAKLVQHALQGIDYSNFV